MSFTFGLFIRRLHRGLGFVPKGKRSRRRGASHVTARISLGVELLEDRITPVVTDLNTGNTFATIQAAVNAANPGDTILADAGVYAENVTVNKALILEGAQHGVDPRLGRAGAESILDAATNGGKTPFYVTVSSVTIDGFTVQNATSVNQFGFGILLGAGTSSSHVLNNIIQNNIAGLSLANNNAATQTLIQRNLFQNNNRPGPASGSAIYTDQFNAGGALTSVLIDSNTFTGNTNASVQLGSTQAASQSRITISNNTFTTDGNAVFVGNATSTTITRNTITASAGSQIAIVGGVNGLSITQNFIDNGTTNGVRVLTDSAGGFAGANQNITLNSNHIQGNSTAGLNLDVGGYTGTLDARNNWWGSLSGPSTPSNPGGTGDKIIDPENHVIFSPFLTSGTDAEPNTPGFQPTTSSFSFAVSAVDNQVYMHRLDLNGGASASWTRVAPGQFLSVAAGAYGAGQAPVVFGVGTDLQVYEAKFDGSGHLLAGWFRVAPGQFSSVVVGSYGVGNQRPILFGIGAPAVGRQVFVATFDPQANLASGWGSFAPGAFLSLAVADYGSSNPEVLGISTDQQVYDARFNASGGFVDGWMLVAPGQFQSIAAANTATRNPQLFGVGLNGQAYTATFTTTGALLVGWSPANTNQPVGLTQVTAATLANGNLVAFALGNDQRAYEATFSASTGNKLTGWTQLSTQLFSQLSAGSQANKTKLYGLGAADQQIYAELFDAAGNVQLGFALTAPGRFLNVAGAEQS